MNTFEAIRARKSVRAFLPKAIPSATLEKILDAASCAPSGTNTQPWQVAVVSGNKKSKLSSKLVEAFEAGEKDSTEYSYYPEKWVEPYKSRRLACGLQLYSALDISREEKDKQRAHWRRNYEAFDAPTVLYFFIDRVLEKGSYMDYGMFLQNIMLLAVEEGLATCAQAALAQYPDIVREFLGYEKEKLLLCGMAIGYEDTEHVLNNYRTPRVDLDKFVRVFD